MCTEGSASPNKLAFGGWQGGRTSVAGTTIVRLSDAWTTPRPGIAGMVAPISIGSEKDFKKKQEYVEIYLVSRELDENERNHAARQNRHCKPS